MVATHLTRLGNAAAPGGAADLRLWADRLHPADRGRVVAAFAHARDRAAPYAESHRVVRPDTGQERWLTAFGRFLTDAEGRAVRSVGILYDDTERADPTG